MTLSPTEVTFYAQVIPGFVIAAIAGSAFWERGPRARWVNPMWLFSAAILLGGMATITAIRHSDSGATGFAAVFISATSTACISLVVAVGALEPIAPAIVRLGQRRRQRTSLPPQRGRKPAGEQAEGEDQPQDHGEAEKDE